MIRRALFCLSWNQICYDLQTRNRAVPPFGGGSTYSHQEAPTVTKKFKPPTSGRFKPPGDCTGRTAAALLTGQTATSDRSVTEARMPPGSAVRDASL